MVVKRLLAPECTVLNLVGLPLTAKVRLGWKRQPKPNAPAYFAKKFNKIGDRLHATTSMNSN